MHPDPIYLPYETGAKALNDKVKLMLEREGAAAAQRTDGIVEVQQRKQPTAPASTTFFRFEDKKTAFQGDTAAAITVPLMVN